MDALTPFPPTSWPFMTAHHMLSISTDFLLFSDTNHDTTALLHSMPSSKSITRRMMWRQTSSLMKKSMNVFQKQDGVQLGWIWGISPCSIWCHSACFYSGRLHLATFDYVRCAGMLVVTWHSSRNLLIFAIISMLGGSCCLCDGSDALPPILDTSWVYG